MSLMKRYAEDTEELTRRAAEAAWEPTAERRMKALDIVFRDCGVSARVYADPGHAAKTFVCAAVESFMTARKARVYQHAG